MANSNVVLILLILLLRSLLLTTSSSEDERNSSSQPICPSSFSCRSLGPLSFPFYTANNSACGLCEVNCSDAVPKIKLQDNYPLYDLVQVQVMQGSSVTIQVRDTYFADQISHNRCDSLMYRFPSDSPSLCYMYPSMTLTVLKCAKGPGLIEQVERYFRPQGEYYAFVVCDCYNHYYTYSSGYISENTNIPTPCSVVLLPGYPPSILPNDTDFNNLYSLLRYELTLVLQISDDCQECHNRGGQCRNENQEFLCKYNHPDKKKENTTNTAIISVLATIGIGSVIILILLVIGLRFKIFSRYSYQKLYPSGSHYKEL